MNKSSVDEHYASLLSLTKDKDFVKSDVGKNVKYLLDELDKKNDKYFRLANNISDGVYVEKDGVIVFVNDALVRFLKAKSKDELIGKSAFELFHPDFRKNIESRRKVILSSAGTISSAIEIMRSVDGSCSAAEVSGFAFKEGEDEYVQVVVGKMGVTDYMAESKSLSNPFKQLMEILPDVMFILVEGKIVFVNKAGIKLFGAKDESEFLGKDVCDFFVPGEREIMSQHFEGLYRAKSPSPISDKMVLKFNGDTAEVNCVATPYERNGKIAIQVILRDISEKVFNEKSIAASELRFRSFTENLRDAAWIIDPYTLRYIYCSPVMSTMLGYTMDEMYNDTLIALKFDSDKEKLSNAIRERVEAYMEGKKLPGYVNSDIQYVKKDGTTIYIELSANLFENPLSGKLEIHGISRNITEVVLANRDIVASETKYRMLTENMRDVVWILDPYTFKYSYVSPSVFNILGYTPEEFLVLPRETIYASEEIRTITRTQVVFPKKQVLLDLKRFGKKNIDFSCVYRHKNGSIVNMESRAGYLVDPLTNELKIYGISRDVTEKLKYDNELIEAKNRAEKNEKELQLKNEEYASMNEEMRQTNDELFQIQDRLRYKNKEYETINKELITINSELFEAKKRLEYSEALLVEAQTIAKTGNWTHDFSSGLMYWSDEMYTIIDSKESDFPDNVRELNNYIHPDDLEMVNVAFQNHLNLKLPFDIIHRLVTSKGEVKYVNQKCKTDFDKIGKPIRSFGTLTDVTDQKKMESVLVESEQKYRLLTETMQDVAWIIGVGTFSYKYLSPAIYYMVGYTADELLNLSLTHIFYDMQTANSVIDMHRNYSKKLLNGEIERNDFVKYDTIFRHKDGSLVYVEITTKHIVNQDTGFVEIHGVSHDITERVLANKELEASKNELQQKNEEYAAMNEELRVANEELNTAREESRRNEAQMNEAQVISKTGSWVFYPKSKQCFCSDELYHIFGRNRIDLGEDYSFIYTQIHPEEVAVVNAALDEHLNNLSDLDITFRIIVGEDQVKYVNVKGFAEFDKKMKEVRSNGTTTDVTDRIEIDKAREVSEHRFKMLAENTKDIAWVLNMKTGTYEYISPVIYDMLGYLPEEVSNLQFGYLFKDKQDAKKVFADYQKKHKVLMNKHESKGQFHNYETVYQRKDGSFVNVEVSSHFYMNPDTGDFEIHGLTRDISQRYLDMKAIKENERLYVSLVNTLHCVVYRCRYNGKPEMIFVNNEIEKLSGYSKNDFLNNANFSWKDVILSTEKSKIWKSKGEIKSSYYVDEYRILTKTGDVKWVVEEGHVINGDDGYVLEGFINDVTKLKETARLEMNALITGEENERMRLARDLHDGLGPLMTTLRLFMEAIGKSKDAAVISEIALKSEKIYYEAVRTLTEISNNLSPHILQNYGVYDAVRNFIEKVKQIHEMKFELNCIHTCRCENILEITLFRTICELINNSIKHSGGTVVHIDFDVDETGAYVYYVDNGHGFNVEETLKTNVGMGLRNLQSRINNIGGRLVFKSDDGCGFSAKIVIGDKE